MIVADTLFGRLMTLHFEITGTRLTVGRLWSPYNRIHSAGHRGECVQLHCNVSSVVYICSLEGCGRDAGENKSESPAKKWRCPRCPRWTHLLACAYKCSQIPSTFTHKCSEIPSTYTQMFINTKYIYTNTQKYQVHIQKMFTNTKYIYN